MLEMLKFVLTSQARFRMTRCLMFLLTVLVTTRAIICCPSSYNFKARPKKLILGYNKNSGESEEQALLHLNPKEKQLFGGNAPPTRKCYFWALAAFIAIIPFVVSIMNSCSPLVEFVADNHPNMENINKAVAITFTSVTSIVLVTCIWQTFRSWKINKSIEKYLTYNKYDEVEETEIHSSVTFSRNISFRVAVLILLAGFVFAVIVGGLGNDDDGNMLGKSMLSVFLVSVMTVGIGFMVFGAAYHQKFIGSIEEKELEEKDSKDEMGNCWSGKHCFKPDFKKRRPTYFFCKSKSLYIVLAVIFAATIAYNNLAGGADGEGNSQMSKLAIYIVGGTVLVAISIGSYFRWKSFEESKLPTYAAWKNRWKDDSLTIFLKVTVLAVTLCTAIWLTIHGYQNGHFGGNGGQAIGTVWVLYAIVFFGSFHFASSRLFTNEARRFQELNKSEANPGELLSDLQQELPSHREANKLRRRMMRAILNELQ